MNWMTSLYKTYEQGMQLDLPGEKLMPVSHIQQNAHINIVIDGEGNFKRALVLDKKKILLPATEKSAERTSGEAPHPLADKIQYVAKDYPEYGGRKKSYFDSYKEQLRLWCESPCCNSKARAVYKYISKGTVVYDLVNASVMHAAENSILLNKWTDDEQNAPKIFKVLPKKKSKVEQGDAFVCWSVEKDGEPDSYTWQDKSLQDSWIKYDAEVNGVLGYCFVLGEETRIATNYPHRLRNPKDSAKLVSSNDKSGFTFRGRFTDGMQVANVSFEVTQKAHNALRWLISRQGFRNGDDQVFVTWAVSGKETFEPLQSSYELFAADPIFQEETIQELKSGIDYTVDLGDSFSGKLNRYLAGYSANLDPNEQIIIMGLDSATPGRMGIIYYRQLLASEFLDRVDSWHRDFAWLQRYTIDIPDQKGNKKPKKKVIWNISSPSPSNILKSNNTFKKNTIERIMPCIIDGRPFPKDIVDSAICRASNRNNCNKWEWERNLGVACALYKGYFLRHPIENERRIYRMTFEKDRKTRDYLYGCLLAIADRIEEIALCIANKDRPTTAARLMQRFAYMPFSTWRTIELGLQPYMQRLQSNRTGFLVECKKDLDVIQAAFKSEEFTNNEALTGEFLLGYHCYRNLMYTRSKQRKIIRELIKIVEDEASSDAEKDNARARIVEIKKKLSDK